MARGEEVMDPGIREELESLRRRVHELEEADRENVLIHRRLDENLSFIQTVFDSINDSICILDTETFRILQANQSFLDEVGLSQEEVMGKTCYEITHHRETPCAEPDDKCPLYDTMFSCTFSSADHVHYNAKGEKIFVEVSTHPIRDPDGKIRRVVHVSRDISYRKQLEERLMDKTRSLLELNLNLKKRVEDEITMRLRQEELLFQNARMAATGEMIGAIAHQWRQPLNALGVLIQDLNDAFHYGELTESYIDNSAHRALSQIEFMSRTIDDFRNFLKPSRKNIPFDIRYSVRDVLRLTGKQLEDNDIQVVCAGEWEAGSITETGGCSSDLYAASPSSPEGEGRDSFPGVLGYPNEFKHVVLNLLNNARDSILARKDAEKKGSVPYQGCIRIAVASGHGKVTLRIQDNGVGIPDSVRNRLFERYFTTKGEGDGTGLGLYLSRVIVEEHMHGQIYCAEKRGEEGCEMIAELPVAGPPPAAESEKRPADPSIR